MSGPKSGGYSYDAEVDTVLVNRELEGARIALAKLRVVVAEIRVEEQRLGESLAVDVTLAGEPGAGVRLSEARAYRRSLDEAARSAKNELPGAIARVEMRHALRRIAADIETRAVSSIETLRALPGRAGKTRSTAPVRRSPEEVARKVGEYVGRLRTDVSSLARLELEGLAAKAIREQSPERAEALLVDLSLRIQALNKECRRRAEELLEVRRLLSDLGDDDDPETRQTAAQLVSVERGERSLGAGLKAKAERAAQIVRQRAERTRVVEILDETLLEMGYEVDEEFSTLSVEGGALCFRMPQLGDYAVQLNLHPEDARLNLNVVRHGRADQPPTADQKQMDREMEARWCHEVEPLLACMKRRGIDVQITRRKAPGEIPVKVLQSRSADAPDKEEQRRSPRRKTVRRSRDSNAGSGA
jgi:hypothetical protein